MQSLRPAESSIRSRKATFCSSRSCQEAGDAIKFDKVLAILGDAPKFGAPVVEGASVDASVVKNGKGKKVVIFKYKPKKGYRLRQGHRQPYTKVEIKKINA